MTKQNPRTSHPSNSIWQHPLEEDTFRRNLVTLEERTNAVPIAPLIFDADVWERGNASISSCSRKEKDGNGSGDGTEGGYILPLRVEQQLADEFASLAAVEEGAQSVAAVCVEEICCASNSQFTNLRQDRESKMRKGLRLRFAALDTTLDSNIKSSLQQISTLLCNHEMQESDCMERISELVIGLHERRLLARLRSKKWEKPRYLAKSHKKPLWKDFENLKHRTQFLYSKKEKLLLSSILSLLDTLAKVYEDFENLLGDEKVQREGVKNLVLKSYEFTTSPEARGYLRRLEDSIGNVATAQVSSAVKSLRQIQKVGSYRRICHSLVGISRRYKEVFEGGVEMEFLRGYEGVKTEIGFESWAGSMHVHAEVQLAVFYDLIFQHGDVPAQSEVQSKTQSKPQSSSSPRPLSSSSSLPSPTCTSSPSSLNFLKPRAIGISKSLCFLCFQFLQKHKHFFPSRTHGRLYDQWTVPDLEEFTEGTREKYRRILGAVDSEARGLIEGEPEMWRVEPMTSSDVYCE